MRRWVIAFFALMLAAYGAVWAIPSVHELVAESVLTSRHHAWAWLVATPAQQKAWSKQSADTPNLTTVTPVDPSLLTRDARLGIRLTRISGAHYEGWLLAVHNPRMLHVVLTKHLGRVGEQTSQFGASTPGAIAAVNGGGFVDPAGQGTGGSPVGVTVSNGHLRTDPDNGSDYVIGIDRQERLVVGKWNASQARALGIQEAVDFKPILIKDGKPMITQGDGGWGIGPRTAMAQLRDGTILFAIIDGRQPRSLGATLRQVQDLLLSKGALTAVNLDGGSSTTLWYRGRVLNHPCCSPNGQRYIPDAWVVIP